MGPPIANTESVIPTRPSRRLDIAERVVFAAGAGFAVYLGVSSGDWMAGVIYAPLFGIACVGIVWLVRWCWLKARRRVAG